MSHFKFPFFKRFYLYLFIFSIVIYTIVHFTALEEFPIYFVADEAIQGKKAQELVKSKFTDDNKHIFPLFFQRFGDLYNLGITPYFHIPGIVIFGKNIWVIRLTTAIFSLIGAMFCTLILKQIFNVRNYWVGILFISEIPIFFLHSRTGFETVIASSLYAGFIYFYVLYRTKKPIYLTLSIIFAALSFYSYSGIYVVILSTCLFLFFCDIRYHLQFPKYSFLCLIFGIIVFYPYFQFVKENAVINKRQLEIYGVYLTQNIPIQEKLEKFTSNYLLVFNPNFLFIYHQSYHPRHYLKGYGYFPLWALFFLICGFIYILFHLTKPQAKIIMIILITSPISGVIMNEAPFATRIMPMTISFTLLVGLGIKVIEIILSKFFSNKYYNLIWSTLFFFSLTITNLYLYYDALKNGPTWFEDYTLYGMQYGAKQLFKEIKLSLSNNQNVIVSTSFANSLDIFFSFFLTQDEQQKARLIGVDQYKDLTTFQNTTFIVDEGEYDNLLSKEYIIREEVNLRKVIPAPNNKPEFYVIEINPINKLPNNI